MTGFIWYDEPGNDKQKWRAHKDNNTICFESVKWPKYFLSFHTYNPEELGVPSGYYRCCRYIPESCTSYPDALCDNWLCTACNRWMDPIKTCWKASIFDENAIVTPRRNVDYEINPMDP